MRNVDHHIVGPGPFHLEITMASSGHLHSEPLFLLEALTLGALQLRRGFVEVLDLKTEMVDAAVVRPVGADIGGFFRLPIQDRQVDLAVGQEYGAVRGTPDLLHSESVLVEGGDLCGLLCRQRDVFDSRHKFPPYLPQSRMRLFRVPSKAEAGPNTQLVTSQWVPCATTMSAP